MQDDDHTSPSQPLVNHLENLQHMVNNKLSVYDALRETNDEAESEEEEDGLDNMDVDPADMEGSHTTYVIGGEFEKGMFFESKKLLQEMVKKYSIQRNQLYTTVTSNEKVLHLRCKKNCGWSLRGSHIQAFSVRHSLSKSMQWYAREKSIAEVFGDWESSYGKLSHFMQALQQSNPGTVVVWKHKALVDGVYYSNMEVFERVFWAFSPCVEGFKHCMSVICIDGTHLYRKYKETLLVATSVDANFQVFPLAFALVEGENTSSWSWFLGNIRVHVTQRDASVLYLIDMMGSLQK
ncbi:uncharacterized protein LOC110687528 [Chenopodium quinoa]|uniref:uncharacterized protein LOC110687528 n=1 Tax=Chenopodium quinoa TaxID=63459 RepID=UPI000B77E0D2|nr:uncharacterized protein LOC110687528 [Chenopodium quinoa]